MILTVLAHIQVKFQCSTKYYLHVIMIKAAHSLKFGMCSTYRLKVISN